MTNELPEVVQRYFQCLHNREFAGFDNCLAEEFRYFTDGCAALSKSAFLKLVASDDWRGIEYSITDVECFTCQGAGEHSMMFVRYSSSFSGLSAGARVRFSALESTLVMRKGEEWKIVHTHTSNGPARPE